MQLLDSGAFSVISLNSGVSGCGRALAWQMALELLKRHAGRGAEGLPSWNAAASGLVGGRTWRLAQGLLGEMMGDGPQPDLISFGSVMRGPLSAWPEASALLDEARWRQLQPGMHLFNAAIICLGEGAAWEQVLHLFTGLDAPDAATRHAAISAAANSAATRAAVALVAPAVDVVGVTAALGALDGQWLLAFELLLELRAAQGRLDSQCCGSAVGAVGRWEMALQLLTLGRSWEIPPDLISCNRVLSVLEQQEQWRVSSQLLSGLDETDLVSLNELLRAFEKARQWQKAFEQMCSMRVRRNDIDDISCVALLGACEKVALWRHALQVLPPGANIAQLNTAFASCEKGRRWEEALGLLRSMRRQRVAPDARSLVSVSCACAGARQWEAAWSCLQEVGTNGRSKRSNHSLILAYEALLAALAVPPLDAAHAQLAAQLEFFLALEGLSSLHSWRCSV
ncbi:unnamed protein product [Durusdinium trenchii]